MRSTWINSFIDSVVGNGAFDRFPPPARRMALENAPEFKLETSMPVEQYFSAFTCEDVAAIGVPTLLITGEFSPKFFYQITNELERCMPNTERAMIPRASHGMHNMNPHEYNETVFAFLAKH